jgi:hypothetical protein
MHFLLLLLLYGTTKNLQNGSDDHMVCQIMLFPPDNAGSNVVKRREPVLCSSYDGVPLI